jgi:hypothetical protein
MAKSKNPDPVRSAAARLGHARRHRREWDPLTRRPLVQPPPPGIDMPLHDDYQLALLGLWAAIEGLRAFLAHYEAQPPLAHTCVKPDPYTWRSCNGCRHQREMAHIRGSAYALRALEAVLEDVGGDMGPTDSLRRRLTCDGAPRPVEVFRLLRRLVNRAAAQRSQAS